MQIRHLYRSPLSICLSSSLIRAFRASMVVAVDSSSVTLMERKREGEMFSFDIVTDIKRRGMSHTSRPFILVSSRPYCPSFSPSIPSMFLPLSSL